MGGSRRYRRAAQDVWTQGGGAFTGEFSAEMLKDLGSKWTLTGR